MTAIHAAIRREFLLIQTTTANLSDLIDDGADLDALAAARLLVGLVKVGEELGQLQEEAESAAIGEEVPSA